MFRFSLRDAPEVIPVFPLPGAVLLPRARLPLNIFEPRYLAMLDSYLSFKEEFPDSKHIKEVDRMAQHARDYLDRNKQEDNNI